MTKSNFRIAKTAFLVLVLLIIGADHSKAQSSSKLAESPSTSSNEANRLSWGVESLYHMNSGIRGAASCATSTCHGGPRAGVSSSESPRGSEYPLWLEKDPHAQSWKTMSSDASVKILSKLGILKRGKIENLRGFRNCLACHNSDRNITATQVSPRIAEGVGCESCHGPSQHWFDKHYQGMESKIQAVQNLGLMDAGPLLQRAKICATCHVGGKDRDMNHDIIAAGHPALYFDMAVYHEAYPKHWRDKDQKQTDFRSRLWLAGKIASADAELELLESRSLKSLPVSVWPELSNYQCNTCHVELNGLPKPASEHTRDSLIRGRAQSRNWNLAVIEALSASSRLVKSDLMDSLSSLRASLQSQNPDGKLVAVKAQQLRLRWSETWMDNGKPTLPGWTRQSQSALSIELLRDIERSHSWESAAVAYTAIWATHPMSSSGKLEAAMSTMRTGLLFPTDLMIPNFPRKKNDKTPPTLDEWNAALQRISESLENDDVR
jgi:Cytochrome c554 and c-prime